MTESYELIEQRYDVVIVGVGGGAMRAALGMAASGLRTACVTKVFPTRSHTVAAQGGVAASLARRAGRVPKAIGGGSRQIYRNRPRRGLVALDQRRQVPTSAQK